MVKYDAAAMNNGTMTASVFTCSFDGTVLSADRAFYEILSISNEGHSRLNLYTVVQWDSETKVKLDFLKPEHHGKMPLSFKSSGIYLYNFRVKNVELSLQRQSLSSECRTYAGLLYRPETDEDALHHGDPLENKLAFKELRFRSIFEGSRDGIVFINGYGGIIDCNRRYSDLLGYSIDELRKMSFYEFTPQKYHEWEKNEILQKQLVCRGYSDTYEKEYIHKDGTVFPIEITAYRMTNPLDDSTVFWANVRDIRERKAKQEELENSRKILMEQERLLNFAIHQMPIPVIIACAPDVSISLINDKAIELLRKPVNPHKILLFEHREYWPTFYPDGTPYAVNDLPLTRAIVKGECTSNIEIIVRNEDGDHYVMASAAPLRDDNGEIIAGIVVFPDVTEQKMIQNKLRESEHRLQIVADFTFDWEYWRLPDGHIAYMTPSVERVTGYSPEMFSNNPDLLTTIVHVDDRVRFEQHANSKTRKFVEDLRFRIVRTDGSLRWIHHICRPMFDENGAFLGLRSSNRDVTENIIQEQYYRILFDSAGEAVFVLNENTFENCNMKAQELFRGNKELIIGKTPWMLSPEKQKDGTDSYESGRAKVKRALEGEPQKYEWLYKTFDGRVFPAEVSLNRIHGEGSTMLFAMVNDISERIAMQEKDLLHKEQLQQADKMSSLGVLVSGVAHEINNPNNFIMLNAPILKDVWESSKEILDEYYSSNRELKIGGIRYSSAIETVPLLFEGIEDGAKRIKNIVESLKNYARKDIYDFNHHVNVNSIIIESTSLLRSLINKSTKSFAVDLPDLPVIVKGNKQKLEQVVINLIQNACEALKNRDDAISIQVKRMNDKCIIEVRDEGEGIAESDIPRITDPFFTSKRSTGGTGLGLSVSTGIIKDHNGVLEFESEIGKGTAAKIILPINGREATRNEK